MIATVDQALCDLLRKRLPDGTAVLLGVPTEPLAAVSLTLFGLRDDTRGRSAGWDDVRDADGTLLGRRPPTRRYELSYVVQAHAADPETEHDLLGRALIALTDEDTGLAYELRLADSLPCERGFPPRAGFVLTVNAAYTPPIDTDLAKPADEMHMAVARTVRPLVPPANAKHWARKRIEEA
ncbi:Pvc16 family protein [Kutzneria sp. CA-103260]|uniref:Pvc16 family protein n=1 Tax=Kutzneria sp. CA-103260 TaxID=2802641 RepID=UPI001BA7509D|nr:Pvc16 family protein [Kutzneria sp. CA-103260]QUQ62587.1 hypothetical protein JJ691_02990 [Kutzneria sp. CA-103260]